MTLINLNKLDYAILRDSIINKLKDREWMVLIGQSDHSYHCSFCDGERQSAYVF